MNPANPDPNRTTSQTSKSTGFLHAARNSIDGLRVLAAEKAVQRELLVLCISIAWCAYMPNMYSLLLVVLALLLLATEALNTAIETLCDHVTPEIHPMIKKVKDMGSAAVLLVSCAWGLVVVWLVFQCVAWVLPTNCGGFIHGSLMFAHSVKHSALDCGLLIDETPVRGHSPRYRLL